MMRTAYLEELLEQVVSRLQGSQLDPATEHDLQGVGDGTGDGGNAREVSAEDGGVGRDTILQGVDHSLGQASLDQIDEGGRLLGDGDDQLVDGSLDNVCTAREQHHQLST